MYVLYGYLHGCAAEIWGASEERVLYKPMARVGYEEIAGVLMGLFKEVFGETPIVSIRRKCQLRISEPPRFWFGCAQKRYFCRGPNHPVSHTWLSQPRF